MKKIKHIIVIALSAAIVFGLCAWMFAKEPAIYSEAERRKLAGFPAFSLEALFDGSFTADFETASPDQFPARETFRKLKAFVAIKLLGQSDTNGIYEHNGYLTKIEYPVNDDMLDHAGERFNAINDKFLNGKNVNVYFSIVPDKNMFAAPESGALMLEYSELTEKMLAKMDFAEYIDISDLLSLEDYYFTDSHWRQEKITDVADRLAEKMGTKLSHGYTEIAMSEPFYGVYAGQYALDTDPDTLIYLTNKTIENCAVTFYSTGMPVKAQMYNTAKATGADPYELFLSGSEPLITIENPAAATDKELVVFRDSYGSSLVPLLVSGYAKITVVDTRYMNPALLGNFVKFDTQDVLFIYSTTLLNSSLGIQ